MIDVILPTVTGREASLARCIESYERNTIPDVWNLIVIRDEPTVGLAWIEGMKRGKRDYFALTCDDLEMTSPTWAGACVTVTDRGQLPCPIIRRPIGTLESCGGDMNAPACLISYMQPIGAEVGFSPVPFMSREQADQINMIPAHYLTDTYAGHKGRELGYPTVVTHGYEFTHHHETVGRRDVTREDRRIYDEAMNG